MHPDWARSLRDQCQEAGTPYFFKQWGAWVPYEGDGSAPALLNGQDGREFDHHGLPDLSSHEPEGKWYWPDGLADVVYRRVGKKAAGRLLDGREWNEVPEWLKETPDG